jgi:CheY-like chemotaxis protein
MSTDNDILVVDDHIPSLQLLTELLEKEGYRVRPLIQLRRSRFTTPGTTTAGSGLRYLYQHGGATIYSAF